MKDKIKILVLLLFASILYAQKMPEDYMDEAGVYFNNGDFKAASENYQYVVNNFADYSELYPFALYNLAVSCEKLNKKDEAIKLYKLIISKSFDKNIEKQSSLMGNPYANFSFESAIDIARIYYNSKDYEESLNYYILADTSKLYRHFCGNAVAETYYFLKEKIARCYIGLDEDDTAIRILVQEIFSNGLASNKKIISLLIKTLDQNYDKSEMTKFLKSSISKVYERNGEFYTRLFSKEIQIYSKEEFYYDKMTKEDAISALKENELYKYYLN